MPTKQAAEQKIKKKQIQHNFHWSHSEKQDQ